MCAGQQPEIDAASGGIQLGHNKAVDLVKPQYVPGALGGRVTHGMQRYVAAGIAHIHVGPV